MAPDQVWGQEDPARTLRSAVRDIWLDTALLVQQHAALAASEAGVRTAGLRADLVALVAAVALLHAAVFAAIASAGFALHMAGLAPWLAMLVVAVVAASSGLAVALWARARLVRRTTARSETLVALRETASWIDTSLRGDRT